MEHSEVSVLERTEKGTTATLVAEAPQSPAHLLENEAHHKVGEEGAGVAEKEPGVLDKAGGMLKNVVSLYDGVGANIMKEGPSSAVYLGIYESIKLVLLSSYPAWNPLYVYLISGAAGELFGSVLRSPSEAIKTRLQAAGDLTTKEAIDAVIFSAEGRAQTFRAWQATLWRDIPMGAVQIALFEGIKTYIIEEPHISFDVTTLQGEALVGAFAGMVGAFITTAPDIVITRINLASKMGKENVSATDIAHEIYREEGVMGFTTGIVERTLYWGPAIGIFLSAYCSIRQFFLPHL